MKINKSPLRPWEVWDDPGEAERIDAYWRGSPEELAYRKDLARLVADEMSGPDATILEVGCGSGLFYEALRNQMTSGLIASLPPDYRGVDNSVRMLTIARKRLGLSLSPLFKRADAFDLPFRDGTFDIAVAFEVFGHMPDCRGPIAELIRVAKRTAIFTVWMSLTQEITQTADHYDYPMQSISDMITNENSFRLQEMPYATAFIVHKGAL